MQLGSATFESYARTLRRIYWAEFIEDQIRESREKNFRASLLPPVEKEDSKQDAAPVNIGLLVG